MNTDVLERLGNYAGDARERKSAIGEYIHSLGIEPTEEYIAVLEYIYVNKSHPAADEIFLALNPAMPELSRTRIHTILEILSKLGAVNAIQIDRYEVRYDGDTDPHAHFVCSKCGEVENMSVNRRITEITALPEGAIIHDVQLLCQGECKYCRDRNVN